MEQEQEEFWRIHLHNKPLTARVKFVLLVVNSVKLPLIASKITVTLTLGFKDVNAYDTLYLGGFLVEIR